MLPQKNSGALEKLDGLGLGDFQKMLEGASGPVTVAFMPPEDPNAGKLSKLMSRAAGSFQGVRFVTCDPRSCDEVARHYSLEYVPDVLVFDGLYVTERLYGIQSYEELCNIVENGVRRASEAKAARNRA